MLNALRRSAERRQAAGSLAVAIAARARAPEFFRDLGRAGHLQRALRYGRPAWLAGAGAPRCGWRPPLSQGLVNALFDSFEDALREQGAGDMGMTRRIKKIADAFYGRLDAYRKAEGRAALAAALLRNIYGADPACAAAADHLADYALANRAGAEAGRSERRAGRVRTDLRSRREPRRESRGGAARTAAAALLRSRRSVRRRGRGRHRGAGRTICRDWPTGSMSTPVERFEAVVTLTPSVRAPLPLRGRAGGRSGPDLRGVARAGGQPPPIAISPGSAPQAAAIGRHRAPEEEAGGVLTLSAGR